MNIANALVNAHVLLSVTLIPWRKQNIQHHMSKGKVVVDNGQTLIRIIFIVWHGVIVIRRCFDIIGCLDADIDNG